MTRFLAEQLATAHWFDQRRTREALQWQPSVSLDEGFAALARSYADVLTRCRERSLGYENDLAAGVTAVVDLGGLRGLAEPEGAADRGRQLTVGQLLGQPGEVDVDTAAGGHRDAERASGSGQRW